MLIIHVNILIVIYIRGLNIFDNNRQLHITRIARAHSLGGDTYLYVCFLISAATMRMYIRNSYYV